MPQAWSRPPRPVLVAAGRGPPTQSAAQARQATALTFCPRPAAPGTPLHHDYWSGAVLQYSYFTGPVATYGWARAPGHGHEYCPVGSQAICMNRSRIPLHDHEYEYVVPAGGVDVVLGCRGSPGLRFVSCFLSACLLQLRQGGQRRADGRAHRHVEYELVSGRCCNLHYLRATLLYQRIYSMRTVVPSCMYVLRMYDRSPVSNPSRSRQRSPPCPLLSLL